VVTFLRSIPMGALLPLMLMLFATGEKQKVMFIFFAIVPFVFSDTVKAISIVPQRYVETAQTLGASNRQILSKVLVPLALPEIVTSLRFQFGLALGYVMLAEAIATTSGLGVMLNTNERMGNIEQNYALLFIIALLAFVIDFLIRFFQRGVFQWRSDL
jgi:ABC-type nitrate/sulfonate/bicarbonate transport system permease component